MSQITLTIDGKEVMGERGDTILKVCERHGIYVPTLCHFKGLHDVGTCRMCIVEIQGGRALTTACTTPAEEGMVVTTTSERLEAMRRSTLELLFSERNHYCMFCESSGDCELQALAYRHGMDSVRYPPLYPIVELDSSHPYHLLDHNRCVLCRRCVRACAEKVTNHTLGVRQRGIETMLCADGGEALGDSSCVSCGTCVQVCPTGAMFDRRSVYHGRLADCSVVRSTCVECSLGCPVELVTRSNQVLRVQGDMSSTETGGLLCKRGRYESLNGHRERVLTPLVRTADGLHLAKWEEALAAVRTRLEEVAAGGSRAVAGAASARVSNEALTALRSYFREVLNSHNVGALGAHPPVGGAVTASLADVRGADLILLAGDEIGAGHQVLEFIVGQAVEQDEAWLVIIGSAARRLVKLAKLHVPAQGEQISAELAALSEPGNAAAALVAAARRPVLVLSASTAVPSAALAEAAVSADKGWPRVLLLGAKANSRGAAEAGLSGNGLDLNHARAALIVAGDDLEILDQPPADRSKLEFLAVQASYRSPLTEMADVVLPAPVWTERQGTLTNAQGQQVALRQAVTPPGETRDEAEVLSALAAR